eukprot:COSAG02_NODE_39284_length_419_cov_0.640625_1_plen_38_part_01
METPFNLVCTSLGRRFAGHLTYSEIIASTTLTMERAWN